MNANVANIPIKMLKCFTLIAIVINARQKQLQHVEVK